MNALDSIMSSDSAEDMENTGLGEMAVKSESTDQSQSVDGTQYTESEVETLLTEKLLQGFVLQTKCCPSPACNDTPLVKAMADIPKTGAEGGEIPSTVSDDSLTKTQPITGVSYCVACSAHVMTTKEEVRIMTERNALVGGAVLLAMSEDEDDEFVPQKVLQPLTIINNEPSAIGCEAEPEPIAEQTENLNDAELEKSLNYIPPQTVQETEVEGTPEPIKPQEPQETAIEVPNNNTPPSDLDNPTDTSEVKNKEATVNDADEYEKKRQIATKVLGAKMLQGYTLRETLCEACSMPMMETPDSQELVCVVCPVLEKKAKKEQKKEMKRLEAENLEAERLEAERLEAERLEAEQTLMEAQKMQAMQMQGMQMDPAQMQAMQMQGMQIDPAQIQAMQMQGIQMDPAQIQAMQMQGIQMDPAQMQALQMQGMQMDPAQMQALQMQGMHMDPSQIQAMQMQGMQMDPDLVQIMQMQEMQMDPDQIQAMQIQGMQIDPVMMQGTQMDPSQIQAMQMQGTQIDPSQMQAMQMQGTQIDSDQMQAMQMQGTQMDPTQTDNMHIQTQMAQMEISKMQNEHDEASKKWQIKMNEQAKQMEDFESEISMKIKAEAVEAEKIRMQLHAEEIFRMEEEKVKKIKEMEDQKQKHLEEQEALRISLEAEQDRVKRLETERLQNQAERELKETEEAERRAIEELRREEEERLRREELEYIQEMTRHHVMKEMENDRDQMIAEHQELETQRIERAKLIEQLRQAKLEREEEEQRYKKEIAKSENEINEAKRKEELRNEEQKKLVDELRLAKEAKEKEEKLREEEKALAEEREKESKQLEEERQKETLQLKEQLEAEKRAKLAEADLRQKTIREVEEKSKKIEEDLKEERKTLDEEATLMEEMRVAAENKVVAAEKAMIQAEEKAAEAMSLQAGAMNDDKHVAMEAIQRVREAKKERLEATAYAKAAEQAYIDAEQSAADAAFYRSGKEDRFMEETLMAQQELSAEKARLLTEAHNDQRALLVAEKEVEELEKILSGKKRTHRITANSKGVKKGWAMTPEYSDPEEDEDDDIRDDSSRCSNMSITLELPEGFDPSDPAAMAELVQSAARSVSSRRSRSVSSRRSNMGLSQRRDEPESTFRSRPRSTRNGSTPRNRLPPSTFSGLSHRQKSQQMQFLPPRNRNRSQSPRFTPENKHIGSASRTRSLSRTRKNSYMSNPSNHVVVTSDVDDDASCLTGDRSSESNALTTIMYQIEACKEKLTEPLDMSDAASMRSGIESRNEALNAIEQLSAAATAIKNLA